jgi:spore coat protein U-like protein
MVGPAGSTSVGVLSSDLTQTFTNVLSVQCTNSTDYAIGLSAGTGSGATVAARKMTGPASATVTYSLYSDSYTTVWGTSSGVDTVGATGNGAAQTYTIYGKVPTQTTPAPGVYSDTVTVTVYY